MPIADASENRVIDALLGELAKIGTPPSAWLTAPKVPPAEGTPADALEQEDLQVFVDHDRTEPLQLNVGTQARATRGRFLVFYLAKGPAGEARHKVRQLKADGLRALFAAMGTFRAQFKYGVDLGAFQFYDDLAPAGFQAGGQEVLVDFEMSHAEP